ncbi:T9SS type A sorting domain-containing protein [candidate division WOR-3 bacterium]|nr:T9SS type A sorting domain-containing protein [candidate division WOR-3 bacterium]
MKQFRWRKGTIAEGMGRKFWIFVRRLKIMRRILQICLIMMLPGFLWAGNESSRRTDRLSSTGIYAYVTDNSSGLYIIDVSDPTNPTEVGFYDDPGWAFDVYVSENYAYVADGYSGLRIIDVSDPTNPFEAGFYDTPEYAIGVYFSGIYAYVADCDSGLRIIDVSDPTNPFEAGYCNTTYCNSDVYVSGNYAYAGVVGVVDVVDRGHGLVIIDVSDPTNPFEEGYYELNEPFWVEEPFVSGNYAYLAKWSPVKQGNSDQWDIFEIIDVSDPSNPFHAGGCMLPSIAMGVYVVGNYAYLAGWEHGLQIIDIKDPRNPFVAGSCNQTADYLYGVKVLGNYAYAADAGGYGYGCLRVYDVSDPTMPFEVGLSGDMLCGYAVHVVDYEPPQVSVISPNGGETFVISDTCDIFWLAEDNVGAESISILYSIDAGINWDTIATGEPNDSTYEWIIPNTLSDSCLVKILAYDISLNIGEDQSDSFFSISSGVGIEKDISFSDPFILFQVSPNPFSKTTVISFQCPVISEKEKITLSIYDSSGRLVKSFSLTADHSALSTAVSWDGKDDSGKEVRSGVYFCRFVAGDYQSTQKLLLLR